METRQPRSRRFRYGLWGGAVAVALSLAAGIAALSCRSTTIGCDEGLYVVLDGLPPQPFRLELTIPTAHGDSVITRTCRDRNDPGSCEFYITPTESGDTIALAEFDGLTPWRATLRATWRSGTKRRLVLPSYVSRNPNGWSCLPPCKAAVVRLRLGAVRSSATAA